MARQFLLTILLGTALATPTSSVAQILDDQCELPPGSGTISGTVTSSVTQFPAFAFVTATTEISGAVPESFSIVTGFDGSYTIEVAAPATYVVSATALDQQHAPELYDGVFTRAAATEIGVDENEDVTDVDFTLVAGATLSGNVTADVTGDPVAEVGVFATSLDDIPHVGIGVTDNDGDYTLTGLAPQTYQVMFFPEQDVNNLLIEVYDGEVTVPGDPVDVTFPGVDGIDAGLAQGGRIEGTVTGPGNQPVEFASIIAFTDGPYKFGASSTDDNGDYSVVVPTGTYQLFFSSAENLSSEFFDDKLTLATADDVSVNAPATTANIDAQLGQSGKIAGRVTDTNTGDGIEGVGVTAFDATSTAFVDSTITDAQGDYELHTNLRTGTYKVGFDAPERVFDGSPGYADIFYSSKQTLAGANSVSVTAPQTTSGIDQELVPCDEVTTTTGGPTTTTVPDTTTTTVSTTTSTTGETTTTTLGTGGECGDPVAALPTSASGDVLARAITASDALFVLRTAVGSASCLPCVCDVNGIGGVTATDALVVLRRAVGQTIELQCPACDA